MNASDMPLAAYYFATELPPSGWIWMQIAPNRFLDNGSRDLGAGETVLLRTAEAARLEADGVVIPYPIRCGALAIGCESK